MSRIRRGDAQGPYVLAIDIGTSAVRAGLFDRIGRAVPGVEWRQGYAIRTSADGASETDPDALLETVWNGVDGVLHRAGPRAQGIVAVASCTFVGNILGVDQKGRAVTPLMTYADTRAEVAVEWLRSEFDEAAVHDRCGCHFHSSYLPARLRWLALTQPAWVHQVKRWISIGEYLELKLFGATAVSYSVASWTGLLNRHRLDWDEQLLAKLPVAKTQLSSLVDIEEGRRGLRPEFAARWPGLRDVPWLPAVGDGAAANIGSGCTTDSRVALTMGTTTALRAVSDHSFRHVPEGLWCYRVDRRRSLPGGALSEGGGLFAWMRSTLQLPEAAQLEKDLAALEPDAHGLTVLPFLAGERSPGWRGHARATLHGLSVATRPLEILRAGMEAVAYRVALVFAKLVPILPAEPQVIVSGGALQHSAVWPQIITDVLGRPTALSRAPEASARGAALLAFEALGMLAEPKDIPDFVEETLEPDAARHAVYCQAVERQQRLYARLVQES
ncbi:MAG: gluconokinase [Desulfobacterales bacterium]|nr:MAG: gluconokinase [Desulfobacterales bacterium]